jgi:hypothetical protein
MCRGENVQCKECSRLSTRIVQLCIRGELMVNCPEIIIEGVSLEKEECRLCRYGSARGKIIMPSSVLVNANNHDREAWRASKEQPMPRTVRRPQSLKSRDSSASYSSNDTGSKASSRPPSPDESQLRCDVSTSQRLGSHGETNAPESATQFCGSKVLPAPTRVRYCGIWGSGIEQLVKQLPLWFRYGKGESV